MTSLFPARESLVSDIPAGDGKIEKFFYVAAQHPPLSKLLSAEKHSEPYKDN
jgi:hypothetical protein